MKRMILNIMIVTSFLLITSGMRAQEQSKEQKLADKEISTIDGKTAYDCAKNEEIKNLLSNYRRKK